MFKNNTSENHEILSKIAKRLAILRGNQSLTDFSASVNCSNARMHYYLNEKSLASVDILLRISKVYDVSIDWILGNENKTNFNFEDIKFIKVLKTVIDINNELEVEEKAQGIGINQNLLRIKLNKKTVAGIYNHNNMLPTIFEGDVVIIDTSDRKLLNNHLYVVPFKNEWIIKRYRIIGQDHHWCDDQYPSSCVNEKLKTLGRIIGQIKSYKTNDMV